jgi:hypothetical protein
MIDTPAALSHKESTLFAGIRRLSESKFFDQSRGFFCKYGLWHPIG